MNHVTFHLIFVKVNLWSLLNVNNCVFVDLIVEVVVQVVVLIKKIARKLWHHFWRDTWMEGTNISSSEARLLMVAYHKNYLTKLELICVYHAIIISSFMYAASVYGQLSATLLAKRSSLDFWCLFQWSVKVAINSYTSTKFELNQVIDNLLLDYRNSKHLTSGKTREMRFKKRQLLVNANNQRVYNWWIWIKLVTKSLKIMDSSDNAAYRRHRDQITLLFATY